MPLFGSAGVALIYHLVQPSSRRNRPESWSDDLEAILLEVAVNEFNLALKPIEDGENPRIPRFDPQKNVPFEFYLRKAIRSRMQKHVARFLEDRSKTVGIEDIRTTDARGNIVATNKGSPGPVPQQLQVSADQERDLLRSDTSEDQSLSQKISQALQFYDNARKCLVKAQVSESAILVLLAKCNSGTSTQNRTLANAILIVALSLRDPDYALLLGLDLFRQGSALLDEPLEGLDHLALRPLVDRQKWEAAGFQCNDPSAFMRSTMPNALMRAFRSAPCDLEPGEFALLRDSLGLALSWRAKAHSALIEADQSLGLALVQLSAEAAKASKHPSAMSALNSWREDPWKQGQRRSVGGRADLSNVLQIFGFLQPEVVAGAIGDNAGPSLGRNSEPSKDT